jgi:ribosomal-protein-alanine N-acetyltransferase
MELPLRSCTVRSWRTSDLAALVRHANNRNISVNLRDRFPHPYSTRDGRNFLRTIVGIKPETVFAIVVDGEAVGCIGFLLQHDVERVSGEIGYWLGEAYWGRGIMSDAVVAVTSYAIEHHQLTRLFAVPFAFNTGSSRVLEKAGYVLEARLRRSAVKDGAIVDQLQYAFIAPEPGA